jgi:flagellum-specific ATP synthase
MQAHAGLSNEIQAVAKWSGPQISGRVTHVVGLLIESSGPAVHTGEICHIYDKKQQPVPCEVVGFKDNKILLMPLGEQVHIAPGAEVYPTREIHRVAVSASMCGRVLDALGNPIDGKGPIKADMYYPVNALPPDILSRKRIEDIFETGIKAIDGLCTSGKGQRFGIFSGSGVGKSSTMGMIARMSSSDINVIALIGERGREVREFIERDLGEEGLERSVVIVATSDQAALLRSKGASVATAIAEYFRDQGKSVCFLMDSITRFAMALREIGLAIGEPPTTKGYTPSVFAHLPKLLERAGNSDKGSITGIYSILVEGDDLNDPIADTVRSILDGHIVLSRDLASSYHYPPIDILHSLSRVMQEVIKPDHHEKAGRLRSLLRTYKEAEDLINIGAYVSGSNPAVDEAIMRHDKIKRFLQQDILESFEYETTLKLLTEALS